VPGTKQQPTEGKAPTPEPGPAHTPAVPPEAEPKPSPNPTRPPAERDHSASSDHLNSRWTGGASMNA
ncbi:MAG TPA: hypothetical protein VIT23_00365, partial [Terrimicrobiaceae bacterium]